MSESDDQKPRDKGRDEKIERLFTALSGTGYSHGNTTNYGNNVVSYGTTSSGSTGGSFTWTSTSNPWDAEVRRLIEVLEIQVGRLERQLDHIVDAFTIALTVLKDVTAGNDVAQAVIATMLSAIEGTYKNDAA